MIPGLINGEGAEHVMTILLIFSVSEGDQYNNL